jgi:hypothetical protein
MLLAEKPIEALKKSTDTKPVENPIPILSNPTVTATTSTTTGIISIKFRFLFLQIFLTF